MEWPILKRVSVSSQSEAGDSDTPSWRLSSRNQGLFRLQLRGTEGQNQDIQTETKPSDGH